MSYLTQSLRYSLLFVLSVTISINGCSNNLQQTKIVTQAHQLPYPKIDHELGEKLQPNEEILAKQIADHIGQAIHTQYTSGNVLRDAHPKTHGCVRAEFHVSKSLPKNLAKRNFCS